MTSIYVGSSWLAGIFLGSFFSFHLELVLVLSGLILAVLILTPGRPIRILGLCLLILLAGFARHALAVPSEESALLRAFNGKDAVTLRGTISSEPDVRDRFTSLMVRVKDVLTQEGWERVTGSILVQAPRFVELSQGDRVELIGKLSEPRTTGSLDYKAYLARQGIYAQMRYPKITHIERNHTLDWLSWLSALKLRLARRLELALPEPQASVAEGILLGMRTGMPHSLTDAFSRTNTSHILAVSGWNITLVAGLLTFFGGRIFGRRRLLLTLFLLSGIGFYTILIGPQASVLRAAIMGGILICGSYFGRPGDSVVSLLVAAGVMTALDPFLLWDLSFQLSFAATAGIALLAPRFHGILAFQPRWLSYSLATTFAAQLSTLPIGAVNFGQLSTITTVSNLLIEPALLPIMLFSALAALLGLLWMPLAQVAGWLDWVFLTYLVRAIEYTASMPWASVHIGKLLPLVAIPYYAFVFLIFLAPQRQTTVPTNSTTVISLSTKIALGLLTTVGVLVWSAVLSAPDESLRVSFLDVGQGDAILVETPSGRRMLVDGGPSPSTAMEALGRRMPFWDKSVDVVVLTHPNDDHLAGLLDILNKLDVKQVLDPGTRALTAGYRRWEGLLKERGVRKTVARAGQEISFGDGMKAMVLHPTRVDDRALQIARPSGNSSNADSVVLRLVVGGVSFLLTGDVDRESQREMLLSGMELASTVLKVPHHGARDALDDGFLKAVNPQVAVISVGKDNQFGHPSEETLAKLAGTHMLRTDLDGTVEVVVKDGTYEVRAADVLR